MSRQLHEFVAWTHVAGDSQRLSISLQKVSFHTRVFCTESTDMAGVAKTDDIEHGTYKNIIVLTDPSMQ